MGIPRLERPESDDGADIVSYVQAIHLLRAENRRCVMRTTKRPRPCDYTIPHPKKDDPYVTVELDYVGNFGDDKDPNAYALGMLEWE